MLGKGMPPRVRAGDQERPPTILTDGEIRRESYSNRFAMALDGVDLDNPGNIVSRSVH
jgi:5-methyltetrahydropteroyltriglutamate--homocysteine methyltransferase